jgi:8-oxo-dGTP diphosphatase
MMMIDVTCAVIRNEDNEVLIVQRGENTDHPFKWEFPGGKVNKGESEDDCIIREIREELSMEIVICGKLPEVNHDYGHKKIRLIPFICDTLDDIPFLSEHVAYKWLDPEKLTDIDFSEADIPVAGNYLKSLSRNKSEKAAEPDPEDNNTDVSEMLERMMRSREADWLATSTAENPAIFRKLIEYSFSSDKKLAFHASWILSKACEKDPVLISPSILHKIIASLKSLDNESVSRSFLKIITLTNLKEIDSKDQGILADFCFSSMNSGFSSIAVKAYSMEIIYNLTSVYPELAAELEISIRSIMEEESSAGITSRGRMILKKLYKP